MLPMRGMDDDGVERQQQTSHGDTEAELDKAMTRKVLCTTFLISFVLTACIMVPFTVYGLVVEDYFVAIDSASVLRSRTGDSFNLTLGIASRSPGTKACMDPDMYVEVLYPGVQVAASDAVGMLQRRCAKPRGGPTRHGKGDHDARMRRAG